MQRMALLKREILDRYDVQAARAAIAPLRVEEMEPWLRLGIAPQA